MSQAEGDSNIFQESCNVEFYVFVLDEFILKNALWKLRGMLSRKCTAENSQTQMTFQCWGVGCKTEVCVVSSPLTWINEVEMA